MTERKFTPPTEFPAEYVDGDGGKVVIYGRGHGEHPLIGQAGIDYGEAMQYTEDGLCLGSPSCHLHDTPKRISTWHNVYGRWFGHHWSSRRHADEAKSEDRRCVYRIERDEDGGNPEIFVEKV